MVVLPNSSMWSYIPISGVFIKSNRNNNVTLAMSKKKEKLVHVSAVGNLIKVITHTEEQQQYVIDTMVKPGNCVFEGFEPWEDDIVILTFRILDFPDIKPIQN